MHALESLSVWNFRIIDLSHLASLRKLEVKCVAKVLGKETIYNQLIRLGSSNSDFHPCDLGRFRKIKSIQHASFQEWEWSVFMGLHASEIDLGGTTFYWLPTFFNVSSQIKSFAVDGNILNLSGIAAIVYFTR
jgi:hypothetical protein